MEHESQTDREASPSVCNAALAAYQEHRERIQSELTEFLSEPEARETATHIYNLALDIDENITTILKDPLARRLYDYDGRFFTPRGARGFHTAFDGLHFLNWLSDSMLATFFRAREKPVAIPWLLDELGKHAWVAERRRMNWELSQTLDPVPKEILRAILRQVDADPPPLSPEEQAFFQSFEEQMLEVEPLPPAFPELKYRLKGKPDP
jgi:hypothetical protein